MLRDDIMEHIMVLNYELSSTYELFNNLTLTRSLCIFILSTVLFGIMLLNKKNHCPSNSTYNPNQ